MKTPCLKCGLIHDEPTAICDGYAGVDISDDVAANNRKKAVERIRAVLASVPVEARSGGRARAAAAGAGAHASSASGSSGSQASSGLQSGPMRPSIVGSATPEPPPPPEVPEWRREVTERLESYRSRRERQRASQSVLAFRVHSKTDTLEAEPGQPDLPEQEMAIAEPVMEASAIEAPVAEAARVYTPVDDGAEESLSEQSFAAAVEAPAAVSNGTAETTMIAVEQTPALRGALTIPAEPAIVMADSSTLEVHADPAELADVQTVASAEAALAATIPTIDANYWHDQRDMVATEPAINSAVPETSAEASELECGSLTSGFEIGTARIEEPIMEHDAATQLEALQEIQAEGAAVAEPVLSETLDSPVAALPAIEGASLTSAPAEEVASETPEYAGSIEASEEELETEEDRRRSALRTAARPPLPVQPERMEISVPQPVFDFSAANFETQQPQDQGLPVADLRERRMAAILDASILAFTLAGFFVAFKIAGGEFPFTRVGAAIGVAAAFLIYAQYILLFTMVGGGTPGMVLRGLRVVCFDGKPPDQVDLTWRGLGYLLSAAAGMLGFLWSAWDEHGLTWHDRVSQTYITYAEPVPAEVVASAS
jgi:uncharacterized RDD family membrane protein YckC